MLEFDRTRQASSTEPVLLQMIKGPSRTLALRATYSAPMLLSAAACRRNVGQLPSPPYAATAWRRSVSISHEPDWKPYCEACSAHWLRHHRGAGRCQDAGGCAVLPTDVGAPRRIGSRSWLT